MPIPARQVQQTITRATRTFMRGLGTHMVPTSTLATAPSLAAPSKTPPTIHPVGVDSHSAILAVPAIAMGATYALAYTLGLPNLTSWNKGQTTTQVSEFTPQGSTARREMITQGKDVVIFLAHLDGIEKTDTALVVVSQTCTGLGKSFAQNFLGPILPTGRTYQAFAATGVVVFSALTAYAGGNVTLHVSGTLHVQPG
jgi:hypothetical protein